jgi:peptidoglycan/xylan/chitin deacetylase (PgdA/CDA1 family)
VRRLRFALLAVVAAIAIAACGSGGTSTGRAVALAAASHHRSSRGHHSGPRVRNATPQPDWRPFTGPVPILVYHDLGTPPASEPYPGLYVSDVEFEQQMAWLHQHGYQAVTLDELMGAWYHGGKLPARPIVITFDNGYVAQATFAPSVMSRYGWPGVLNEITAGHLSNARIESLLRIGWEVDSHSVSHPDLTTLDASELRYQLVASRQFLRRTFHVPANSFCYPSSKYDAAVVAAVKAAGYTNAVTENSGDATSSDPYLLNRFEIESGQGVAGLATDLHQA